MSDLDMFARHTLDLFPGAGTAYCIDNMEDFSLNELYCFPIRSIPRSSDTFRRVRLLALAKDEIDEIDGLEWDIKEWNTGVSSLNCKLQIIRII